MKNISSIRNMILCLICMCISTFSVDAQKLYETTWTQAGTIFGSSTALIGGSILIDNSRSPITIADLASLNREGINSFDRTTTFNFSETSSSASDYLKYGLYATPIALMFSKQGRENAKEIFVMYSEVFALNGSLTAIAKSGFGRYRPFAYNDLAPLETKLSDNTRKSFFSGHTSQASSLSFLTATIFQELYPESNWRYVVWAGAISTPAIMGYLRVKGGRHFSTDVIVGYGVGALVGYFIPKLHQSKVTSDLSLFAANNGLGISYRLL